MNYIEKLDTPDFFIDDTSGLSDWGQYDSVKKRRLKDYILKCEQCNLCCYCEMKIIDASNSSHIEHVIPKSLDPETLTFDYANLLVSCEGNHFNARGDNSKNTCGQIKGNSFDQKNFLNPTLETDISLYFKFDVDTGLISSSGKDDIRANYTCQTLNLNGKNNRLSEARKIAKESLVKNFLKLSSTEMKKQLNLYLRRDGVEFRTFLRYVFKNIIDFDN